MDKELKIGNFLSNDKIETILGINIKEYKLLNIKEIKFLIKWKKRKNNIIPLNSWVSNELLKSHYPVELLKFYESNIKI